MKIQSIAIALLVAISSPSYSAFQEREYNTWYQKDAVLYDITQTSEGLPVMSWCISNVVGKYLPGNDDVVRPIKEQNENKIDGAVALIMAIGRSMLFEKEDTLSDRIESHGIRSL